MTRNVIDMEMFQRSIENPILSPEKNDAWQAHATFNPCVIKANKKFHMLYRAESSERDFEGAYRSISTIGYANSTDGIHFENQKQLIKPEKPWEKFGCED